MENGLCRRSHGGETGRVINSKRLDEHQEGYVLFLFLNGMVEGFFGAYLYPISTLTCKNCSSPVICFLFILAECQNPVPN